jgi:hypothetical protein
MVRGSPSAPSAWRPAAHGSVLPSCGLSRPPSAAPQASRPLLVDLGPEYLAALVGSFAEAQHPVSQEFWLVRGLRG